jgi:hypothetical protein
VVLQLEVSIKHVELRGAGSLVGLGYCLRLVKQVGEGVACRSATIEAAEAAAAGQANSGKYSAAAWYALATAWDSSNR